MARSDLPVSGGDAGHVHAVQKIAWCYWQPIHHMTDAAPLRLRVLRFNIRERLRAVCVHWPEDQFEAMVTRIAETSLKYEGVSTPASPDETSVFRFIQQMNDAVAHVEDEDRDKQ